MKTRHPTLTFSTPNLLTTALTGHNQRYCSTGQELHLSFYPGPDTLLTKLKCSCNSSHATQIYFWPENIWEMIISPCFQRWSYWRTLFLWVSLQSNPSNVLRNWKDFFFFFKEKAKKMLIQKFRAMNLLP